MGMHGLRAQKSPGGLSHTSGASWVDRLTRQSTILARQRTACNRDGCPKTRPRPQQTRSRRNPFLLEQTRCASSCQILLMLVNDDGSDCNNNRADGDGWPINGCHHDGTDHIGIQVEDRACHQSTTHATIIATPHNANARHKAPSRNSSMLHLSRPSHHQARIRPHYRTIAGGTKPPGFRH